MDEYQTPELEEGQSLRVRFRRSRQKPRWLIVLLVVVLPILIGAAVFLLAPVLSCFLLTGKELSLTALPPRLPPDVIPMLGGAGVDPFARQLQRCGYRIGLASLVSPS